ncbi:Flp family type IVb pilin [Rhodobium gokarnense]|uniref:Flp pilus assembly pilin Flp n=1 Tax=Rhodobium gokarnense TaxID=364296 RepID=A0ABT3H8T3_9HYPH|nr:Flp family type IVb pilin [Rhodobium gokarnense]MCW2306798.1 Flp pilus assembly pilin Flp [Rhodobium gokarnense]
MAEKTYLTVSKRQFSDLLRCFAADERGTTAIEYALVAIITGVMAITAISQLGTELSENYFGRILEMYPGSS